MSVEPGMGGQKFIKGTHKKIEELKVLLEEYNSKALINVDGGINNNTKEETKLSDIVTAGSYIIRSNNFQRKIDSLR